jgi:hypothetical protein
MAMIGKKMSQDSTVVLGMNELGDWTTEEYKKLLGFKKIGHGSA